MAKKMGSSADYIVPLVVLTAAGVGLYFLWNKLFPNGPGGAASPAQAATNTTAATNQQASTKPLSPYTGTVAADVASGITPSLSDTVLGSMASQMTTAMQNGGANLSNNGSNSEQVANIFIAVNNKADVDRLYQLFGTPAFNTAGWESECQLLGINCSALDMFAALNAYCTVGDIATMNDQLSAIGYGAVLNPTGGTGQ